MAATYTLASTINGYAIRGCGAATFASVSGLTG